MASSEHSRLLQCHLCSLQHPGRVLHGHDVPHHVSRSQGMPSCCSSSVVEDSSYDCLTARGMECLKWCWLQYEYLWADGVKVVKPIRLTAPEYINTLCDWIESQVCQLR